MIKLFEKYHYISLLLFIIIGIFIFYVSSLPSDPIPGIGFPYKAMVYHVGVFFLFAFSGCMYLSRGRSVDWMMVALLFSFVYAVSDEVHQLFVPGRAASLGDVGIDILGIMLAGMLYFIRVKKLKE